MEIAADRLFLRNLVDSIAPEFLDQDLRRGACVDPSPIHKGDAAAQRLSFFHIVGCKYDRRVFLQGLNLAPQLPSCENVEPQCRFIKEQYLRPSDGRHSDGDLALIAAREELCLLVFEFLEPENLNRSVYCPFDLIFGQIERSYELQILPYRKVLGDRRLLRRHTDQALYKVSFVDHIVSEDLSPAARGVRQAREHPDCRCLSGTVNSEERYQLAFIYAQGESVNRDLVLVGLCQTFCLYCISHIPDSFTVFEPILPRRDPRINRNDMNGSFWIYERHF